MGICKEKYPNIYREYFPQELCLQMPEPNAQIKFSCGYKLATAFSLSYSISFINSTSSSFVLKRDFVVSLFMKYNSLL